VPHATTLGANCKNLLSWEIAAAFLASSSFLTDSRRASILFGRTFDLLPAKWAFAAVNVLLSALTALFVLGYYKLRKSPIRKRPAR
jgi:hypothetical protein